MSSWSSLAHKRTRKNRKPSFPPKHTAGGVWLQRRKHGTGTLLHATCRVPSGAWGTETSVGSASCPLCSGALSQWSTASPRVRLVREGRTPTLGFPGAVRWCPRPSPRPGPQGPHLATRRIPSRGGGAGPLRPGCGGRPRAHVSAGRGCSARPPLAPGSSSPLPRPDRLAPRPQLPGSGDAAAGGGDPGSAEGGGRCWSAPRPLRARAPVVAARGNLDSAL